MALQVAADEIAVVSEPSRFAVAGREQQQPGGFDGAGAEDDAARRDMPAAGALRRDEIDADDPAGAVGGHALDHRFRQELAAAGGERARKHGVLRAVLAVAGAVKADAGPAFDAGRPAGARNGVDQERRGNVERPKGPGAALQHVG